MSSRAVAGVLLVAHGTVDSLEDLPPFLANIRRGHAAPPELVAEVRRRYEAIGGSSPMNALTREVAVKLEVRLGLPCRAALRLWKPDPAEVLASLAQQGITRVASVALAQHSAWVYAGSVERAAAALPARGGPSVRVVSAPNWGLEPGLTSAFAVEVEKALSKVPAAERDGVQIIFTAHSLPVAVVRGGDPYEQEFRASAAAVEAALTPSGPFVGPALVCFQSQGLATGAGGQAVEWLGPDLPSAFDTAKARGARHALVAPIGFLADHVEILYDLDIEARRWAEERGLGFSRTASLNGTPALLDVVEAVARRTLARLEDSAS